MPMFDRRCTSCGETRLDCLEPSNAPAIPCVCGGNLERAWLSRAAAVVGDDIPGGMWVAHGICNDDGSPRKYYSKSEMRHEAARRGLVNLVEHQPDRLGSDKSRHTSRWV